MRISLWYLAHGFTVHSERNILSPKAKRCLIKYNSKGVQTEHVLSPIELKQLFVPFAILFVGYFLATIAFIGELIHHKFIGRRGKQGIELKEVGTSENKADVKNPANPAKELVKGGRVDGYQTGTINVKATTIEIADSKPTGEGTIIHFGIEEIGKGNVVDRRIKPSVDPLPKMVTDLPAKSGDLKVEFDQIDDGIVVDPRTKTAATDSPSVQNIITNSPTNSGDLKVELKELSKGVVVDPRTKSSTEPLLNVTDTNSGNLKASIEEIVNIKIDEEILINPGGTKSQSDNLPNVATTGTQQSTISGDLNEIIAEIESIKMEE